MIKSITGIIICFVFIFALCIAYFEGDNNEKDKK